MRQIAQVKLQAGARVLVKDGPLAGLLGDLVEPMPPAHGREAGTGPRWRVRVVSAGGHEGSEWSIAASNLEGVKPPPSKAGERARSTCPDCGRKRNRCECRELEFLALAQRHGLPEPVRELKFALPRDFRADFAWPDFRVLVEIEGGGGLGRHTSREGFERDCEKYNIAARLGYVVIRFTPSMMRKPPALPELAEVLKERGWRP